jgi:HEAT repeat protein
MTTLSLSSPLSRAALLFSVLLFAGCSSPNEPQAGPTAAPMGANAPGAFDDDARPLTPNESTVSAAGLDASKLASAERNLLAVVVNPESTPAEAQDAAQQLGYVLLASGGDAADTSLTALAPLFAAPDRIDFARLALDRVPGAAVDALYLNALPSATGRNRLGLIDAIGSRGIAAGVPALAALLNDADQATARAAAVSLGRIGGATALAALLETTQPANPALLNARLAAAAKTDAATAARTAAEIQRNPGNPLPQRSAALRSLIAANPAAAIAEIHAALLGSEPAYQAVAIESVATLPTSGSAAALADRLGSYAPSVQIQLIAALGQSRDAGAVPGLLQSLRHSDATVRLAAIAALGRLPGTVPVAQQLATLAAGKGDEAKAAFESLTRLNGPAIDDFVRTSAAAEGATSLRAVFIQQLAARNQTEALPFLLGLRESSEESLRLEALDALRAIAPLSAQQAVIDWAVHAPGRAEQTRAVRALITIILRADDLNSRAEPVIVAIKAGDTPARLALLPVLSRIAGPTALTAAGSLAMADDEAVAAAATSELARWPDATSLPVLVSVAVGTPLESVRNAAATGAARFLTQASPQIRERRSTQTRALLELPLETSARVALINVLSLCTDEASLAAARGFLADPATAAVAQDAVDAISSSLAGPPEVTSSVTTENPAVMSDGNTSTFWQVPANVAGTWIRADLHSPRPVRKIFLDHRGRGWGYPGKFDVQVSNQPDQPGDPVLSTEGERVETVVTLPAGIRGRYVWLRLTGGRDAPLAISELRIE